MPLDLVPHSYRLDWIGPSKMDPGPTLADCTSRAHPTGTAASGRQTQFLLQQKQWRLKGNCGPDW